VYFREKDFRSVVDGLGGGEGEGKRNWQPDREM